MAAWPFALATSAGLATALFWHFALDPWRRAKAPENYPTAMKQWLAMTLFSLGLKQLFLVFAPFAWLIRLFGKKEPAFILTLVFSLAVMLKVGQTPLHWTAMNGHKDVVELLLAHGAEVNAKRSNGSTPLHWAEYKGYKDVAELLRQHGGQE